MALTCSKLNFLIIFLFLLQAKYVLGFRLLSNNLGSHNVIRELDKKSTREVKKAVVPKPIIARVIWDNNTNTFDISSGLTSSDEPSPASGSYSGPLNHSSNFGQLKIKTSNAFPDNIQIQAAGFLEGFLTAGEIFSHYTNLRSHLHQTVKDIGLLTSWLVENDAWIRQQVRNSQFQQSANGETRSSDLRATTFWSAIELVLAQFDGLMAGYSARVSHMDVSFNIKPLFPTDFLILYAFGDMDNIVRALNIGMEPQVSWDHLAPGALRSAVAQSGRCSALVKVTPDLSDLLIGHATWWTYSSMLRIYKHYNFQLSDIPSTRVSFSSYPGLISSMDDWYLLGSGLVVTGTSNDMHNSSLLNLINSKSALSWHRVLAANMLATSGSEWASWAAMYNSGTNTNQYVVVNMNRFTPGGELRTGLLTITELIPGYSVTDDVTQELERGYWPSYNVPYFHSVYNTSGCQEQLSLQNARGEEYAAAVSGLSYQLAPRAKIFRRDAGLAVDVSSLKRLLRSNGYPTDDFSSASPWDAICARGDLDPENPDAYGCYDGKVTSYKYALSMSAEVINGPPPLQGNRFFAWSSLPNMTHLGMPDDYATVDWELQTPRW